MRWFAWLVTVCLLAAGVARGPAPLALDRHDASIEDGSALANLAPRRPTTFAPDKRADRKLDLHAAPPPTVPIAKARALVATAAAPALPSVGPYSAAHRSRGPPAMRSTASHHLFS